MARRKVSPEAQIIALFTGLSDEGKKMVMFGLNAITSVEVPKPTPTKKRTAPKGAMCNVCANEEDHPDHDTTYLSSHPFAFGVPTAGKRSSRKGAATNSTANTEAGTENVSAVGASGD